MPPEPKKPTSYRHLAIPIAFLSLLIVIVVPLPPVIIDILIATNLSLAAIILLTTVYMEEPLQFSVFPSLLLGTTLFRLCLNIATTRLILTADASSPEQAASVAGEVIRSFGEFVAGNNPIVGAVMFIILVVVQFVVITKGATRISEVAARFTLDAMPGKQMAIDADLTAGMIDESEARQRREDVMREADFYGAMDGASKFVRGDSIAGIIITVINVLGGFAVGAISKGWGIAESLSIFTSLTIGDGLVSQIPSFVISIAAALIVARAGSRADLGTELTTQMTAQPRALFFTALFLVVMSVTGLPMLPMLGLAVLLVIVGMGVMRQAKAKVDEAVAAEVAESQEAAAAPKDSVDDLLKVDHVELEVGFGLVKLVNRGEGGDLLDRINLVRRQMAIDLGLVLPPVRIRDNAQLDQHTYQLKIRGAVMAAGQTYPGSWLAMESGITNGPIDGAHTREPAFGLDAWWIEEHQRTRAETLGYTVVDAASVLITHLTEVVRRNAEELLSRDEVSNLIIGLKERSPKLVEEVLPEKVKPGELQKVLQGLLREQVPIRDLETILETLGDWIEHTRDIDVLVEYVRNGLRRTIASRYLSTTPEGGSKVYCVSVDPHAEDLIQSYVDRSAGGTTITMPPSVAGRTCKAIADALQPLIHAGRPPVVLASPQVRGPLRRIIESQAPQVAVLGYNEIPNGIDVESMGLIQIPDENAQSVASAGIQPATAAA